MVCCTIAISTIIIVLYSCIVTTCMCIYTGVSKNSTTSAVYVQKEFIVSYSRTLFCHRELIDRSISTWSSHSPWLYMPCSYLYVLNDLQLLVAYCTLHTASYYFHLELWNSHIAFCGSYAPL